jgi:DNA-binding response OmpR family regulator
VELARNPNRVLDRDTLLESTRHRRGTPYDRSIDIHIVNLRRKIEADPKDPRIIKTVRGAGYVFTPGDD